MCELFELWDCDVTYDYDRLNENTPDSYWTASRDEGVEFRFNELQELTTIHLYSDGHSEYSPVDFGSTDITEFKSIDDVALHAKTNNLRFETGELGFLGNHCTWIKLLHEDYSIHYEFRENRLYLVTVSIR